MMVSRHGVSPDIRGWWNCGSCTQGGFEFLERSLALRLRHGLCHNTTQHDPLAGTAVLMA